MSELVSHLDPIPCGAIIRSFPDLEIIGGGLEIANPLIRILLTWTTKRQRA